MGIATLAGIGQGVTAGLQDLERFKADQQRLEMNKQTMETNAIALNKARAEERQRLEKEKNDNYIVSVDDLLSTYGMSPDSQKAIKSKISSLGYAEALTAGGMGVKRKYGQEIIKSLAEDLEVNSTIHKSELLQTRQQITQIDQQLSDPESKLKPEQIDERKKQKAQLMQKASDYENALISINDKMMLEKMKETQATKEKAQDRENALEAARIRAGKPPKETLDERWVNDWKKANPNATDKQAVEALAAMKGVQQVKTAEGKQDILSNVKFNEREEKFIDLQVDMLAEDRTTPTLMQRSLASGGFGAGNRRMAMTQEIWNRVKIVRPDYNPMNAEINYTAYKSAFAIQRVQLAKTVRPIADKVMKLADKIPQDFDTVPINEQARRIKRLLGNEELAAFEFDKNKLVEEFERMLTGSQMADSRVQRNLDLIRSGYSPRVIKRLAQEVLDITGASEEAATSPMRSTGTPVKGGTIKYDSQGNRVP